LTLPVHVLRLGSGQLSAVDRNGRARDEAAIIGTQPQDCSGDVVGRAQASHRSRHGGLTLRLLARRLEVMGEDRPRGEYVHADALIGIIQRRNLGQRYDAGFAGDITRKIGHALNARDRRHVDDGAPTASIAGT
jgi:hypothetical protein